MRKIRGEVAAMQIPVIDLRTVVGHRCRSTCRRSGGRCRCTAVRVLPDRRPSSAAGTNRRRWSPRAPSSSRCRSTSSNAARRRTRRSIVGMRREAPRRLSYSIGRDAPPDLFEAFNIGEDDVDYSDPFYAAQQRGAFAPNIWPSHPAGLRPALVAYFQCGASVGADPHRGVRGSARAARRLVLAVRRSLDHNDAGHPLRTSRR